MCRFEPARFYEWGLTTVTTAEGEVAANVLVSRTTETGETCDSWSTPDDPLFAFALGAVAEQALKYGATEFGSFSPDDGSEWRRFYKIQSAYLLASSVLERLAYFTNGATVGPTARVNTLGRRAGFVEAVAEVGMTFKGRAVYRSDDPKTKSPMNREEQFAQAAYAVRSNLMHRGKSAFHEASLVRGMLLDLHDVLRLYLLRQVPDLDRVWSAIEPDLARHRWRLKHRLEACA